MNVLIVDDHFDLLDMLSSLVELMGHRVKCASDGAQGLEAAAQFKPDIILSDIGMPIMDGLEFARAIRRQPDLCHVRLVAITGYCQQSDRERSLAAGFDFHFTKPLQMSQLRSVLSS